MQSVQRWITLLVLVLALVSLSVVCADDGEHNHDAAETVDAIDEDWEENLERTEEAAAVHSSDTEEVEETIQEKVEAVKETVSEWLQTETKESISILASVKSKIMGFTEAAVSKAKSALKRCKNMNKSDVKKVAAAAVGIWGVAVGVGYLTTGGNVTPLAGTAAKLKK